MKTTLIAVLLNAALLTGAHAQRRNRNVEQEPEVPMMRPEEAQAVQEQTAEFFNSVRPVAQTARLSTVWIWADTGRGLRTVCFGTAVGDGTRVLTKWSEIAMAQGTILAVGQDGASGKATVTGVYEEEDLAMLKVDGVKFKAVTFATGDAPKLGRMLVAASPDESPVGVGVVAVEARSLREKDQAYLGVHLESTYEGKGVKVDKVEDGSGATEAGIVRGDLILSVAGRNVNSLTEMRNALATHGPGERIDIRYKRAGKEATATVLLKEKPEFESGIPNGRLRMMERMGTNLSLVRSGFPSAIQTDMQLERERCGGPVVDLDGKVIGIAIARADRTRSFIIPAAHLIRVLESDPATLESVLAARANREKEEREAAVARNERGNENAPPQPRVVPMKPQKAENIRRHIDDIGKLLERMQTEMDGLEGMEE